MKLKLMAHIFTAFLVTSCGVIQPVATSSDKVFSEHSMGRIDKALEGAQAYCETRGKNAELVDMECNRRSKQGCNTEYICIDK